MILQSLKAYYDRKAGDPSVALAPEGWELKEIPFVIVVGKDGSLIQIDDLREGEGRARRAKSQLVPASVKRAVNISANLLWDSVEYALGVDARGNPQRVARQHAAFRERLRNTFGERPADGGIAVLYRFLDCCDESVLSASGAWADAKAANGFVSFRLQGDVDLVCRRPGVRAVIDAQPRGEADGLCLVSGDRDKVARLHPAIKGIRGGQPTGTNIVSFNLPAFGSYGKVQGANAPVGEVAAKAYTTALNHLLSRDSRQKMGVGDSTVVDE